MARIVIGAALAATLMASVACSGSSSASPSPAAPSSSTSTFSAQTLSATGVVSGTLSSHEHSNGEGPGDGHGREDQLEGAILSIDASHHSFVVRMTMVTVSADTIIRRGHTTLAFADLAVGAQVHVKGSRDGLTMAAREVNVQNDGGETEPERDRARGVVSGLTGACPAIAFSLGSAKITTSAATEFRHGACAQVVNGAAVKVRGAVQPDGSLLASRVSLPDEEDGGDH